MINIIIGLIGVDPKTGENIWLSKIEKKNQEEYNIDYFNSLINKALNEAAKLGGERGLEGLRKYHAELLLAVSSDEEDDIRPSFHLPSRIISRLSAAGASFDFDPYTK